MMENNKDREELLYEEEVEETVQTEAYDSDEVYEEEFEAEGEVFVTEEMDESVRDDETEAEPEAEYHSTELPVLGTFRDVPEFVYGTPAPLQLPEVKGEAGEDAEWCIELCHPAKHDVWMELPVESILPAKCSGMLIRACLKTEAGKVVSNAVKLRIRKADIDVSELKWDYSSPFIYDGSVKGVELTGMPEELSAEYTGNEATETGMYFAEAKLIYDEENYNQPPDVRHCVWVIEKAEINTSELIWSSYDGFVYDGEPKEVRILNLPPDIDITYKGNVETLAGKYLARGYVSGNYRCTEPIECEWEIERASFDMRLAEWDSETVFEYDKEPHSVRLRGVPEDLGVNYTENTECSAGEYTAVASFINPDAHNYYTPDDMVLNWTIKKKVVDMSMVCWNYKEPFVFNGDSKSIELENLPAGVTAEYSGNEATDAGHYQASAVLRISDPVNLVCEQPEDCSWKIEKYKFDLSETDWNYEGAFCYDGEPHSVMLENVPSGLSVQYSDNTGTEVGTYVATATLIPDDPYNCEAPMVNGCTWAISKSQLDNEALSWTDCSTFVYDGDYKEVRITSEMKDYYVSEYSGNRKKEAGRYYARAEFAPTDADNYIAPGPVGYSWSIARADIDMSKVEWNYSEPFVYDGSEKSVELVNIPDGVRVVYFNVAATDAGDYTAIARFIVEDVQNYNSDLPDMTLSWRINRARFDMSTVKWDEKRRFVYDGNPKTVKVSGLPEGLDCNYTDNCMTGAGLYNASVRFIYDHRNYEPPELESCSWSIDRAPVDLSHTEWVYDGPFVYNGEKQAVYLKGVPDGFFVIYGNNEAVNAGSYMTTAEIRPSDSENYTGGSIQGLKWTIEKTKLELRNAYWDYEEPFTYDGYEHEVVMRGLPEGLMAEYRNNSAIDAGTYNAEVKFKAADPRNYIAPEPEYCKWTIDKANIDVSLADWDYQGPFKYSGRLNEIKLKGLPEGLSVAYEDNAATDTGVYKAKATALVDTANYNTPEIRECVWEIEKADYDMSFVEWDYDDPFVFNARNQSILLRNLPDGVSADYSGNEAVNVGSYIAKAVLNVSDPDNYNVPDPCECEWEIIKADYDPRIFKWDYEPGRFVYDGNKKRVSLAGVPSSVEAAYKGSSATDAGKYLATVALTSIDPNYNDPEPLTLDWTIDRAPYDMSQVRWAYSDSMVYDGSTKNIELAGLPDGLTADYINSFAVDAGTYRAVATFKGNEENYIIPEPMECVWMIEKADMDIRRLRWDYTQPFVYDGEERKVGLIGVPDTVRVHYEDNTGYSAGEYRATARFETDDPNHNPPETISLLWKIVRADFDMSNVRWSGDINATYDGNEKSVVLTGLPEGLECVYDENAAVEVGSYKASVKFLFDTNNFNSPRPQPDPLNWRIDKASYDMSSVVWDYRDDFTYDGTEHKISLLGLPAGVTAVYSGNAATDAGNYEAQASFMYDERNYYRPEFGSMRWSIQRAALPVDVNALEWSYDGPYTYDGKLKGVSLSERVVDPGLLGKLRGKKSTVEIKGIPQGLKVVYEDNEAVDAGVYYAGAKIIDPSDEGDNYLEMVVPKFRWEITRAKVDVSAAYWDYDSAFTYDGTEKVIELAGLPDSVRVSYFGNRAINSGEYEAEADIEVIDKRNYELHDSLKHCWWQITKAEYDMSMVAWVYEDDMEYDGKEKRVRLAGLPAGVRVGTYRGNCAIGAGTYTASAILEYSDRDNYIEPFVPDLRWVIHKKIVDTSAVRWDCDDSTLFIYDKKPKEVRLVGLPEELEVIYSDNRKINAGTYTARAHLIYDARNYDVQDIPDLSWHISKASIDTSQTHWNYTRPFVYDGYEKKVMLINVPRAISVRYKDNRAVTPGIYTAKAYLDYDSENYEQPELETKIDWTIIR